MATSKEDLSRWFDLGTKNGHTHMIVVCDTFDWGDYPVYAGSEGECLSSFHKYNGPNMQKVMEVYDLRDNKDEQLAEFRAWRLPSFAERDARSVATRNGVTTE